MDVIDQSGGGQGITSNALAIVQLVNACATKTVIERTTTRTAKAPTCMSGCL